MASVLQAPLLPSYSPRSHIGGGILLNPSPYRLPPPLPPSSYPSRSNQSLSSPTSSEEDVNTPPSSDHYATPPPSVMNSLTLQYTSDEDHVLRARRSSAPEYSNLRGRRIRFAPLPDPRRAVCVTDSGEELPLPSVFDDDDPSGVSQPKHHNCHTSPSSSLLLGDTVVTPKKLPTVSVSGASAPPIRSSFSSPPSPARAHITLSSTSSTATVTEVAFRTSGSSTRFAKRLLKSLRQKNDDSHRTGSRDSSSSRDETSPSIGIPLGHWVSADDASRPNSGNEEPLYRARSAASNAQPKPKRMLNGRVYGARKNNHRSGNVFDNIPDKEPEFVEWGYGGMGKRSEKLPWTNGVRGRPGAPATEADDDGSGMGWVKKRREERERQKLEELAASKAASKTDVGSPPIPVRQRCRSIPVTVDHEVKMVTPVQPEAEDDDDESSEEDDGEAGDDSSGTEQEDDDGDQEQHAKQVLGAGVERISRHRD
ncbi:hypothetical protein BGY98DRAFT_933003 [Russula aff. rugulosa BPL654]|nr:hypothetical protein BGY98DRAFT_933003 [Russula aff. rugulosa BPL654]